MTYKMIKTKVVRRKVTVSIPGDGDSFTKATVYVTFEILPNKEKDARSYDAEFFNKVVRNIEGLVDADDESKTIEATKDVIAGWLDWDFNLSAMQRAYLDCTIAAGRGN